MFPPASDSPGNQDPTAAAKAPLPPLGKISKGGAPAAPGRGDFLKSMVSGVAPVERGVNIVNQGLDMIRSAGIVDPQILNQFKIMVNALIPYSLQQLMIPGRAPQGSMPPAIGQAGLPPAGSAPPPGPGPGMGAPPPPGPPQ